MEQEVLKNEAAKAATARRAEGGNTSEPQLDFDRQDQAVQYVSRPRVKTDPSRDALLTAFGKATLTDRYLMPGETFQDLFARVASYYGDDEAHAQRLY
ncbi:MAG: ribonucleotide-diphosphate reductase subunit alpha, partial [Rhodobiaceae bacterium]|nr:ribonucleotide-diphosphate reductase subunit alpha [Rhodobiaceae bacterium]